MDKYKDFWLRACLASQTRAMSKLQQAHYSSHAVAVSSCAFATLFSGIWYVLWLRVQLQRRRGIEMLGDRIWRDLGRFSGCLCFGCLVGVASFATHMHAYTWRYESRAPGIPRQYHYHASAMFFRYLAAFGIFYSVQLLFMVYAKSILLRRVSDHASHSYYNEARNQERGRMTDDGRYDWRDCVGQYKLYYLVRSMHIFAMLLCVLNVVARILAAVFRARTGDLYDLAATACDAEGRETNRSRSIYENDALTADHNGNISGAVSSALVAAILVFMAGSFLLFFPACIVMFRRVEQRLNAIILEMSLRSDVGNVFLPLEFSDGAPDQLEMPIGEAREFLGRMKSSATAQRRRFIFCLIMVLGALVSQASVAVLIAIVAFSDPLDHSCSICETCQSVTYLMLEWYDFTPEMFPLVASLCSTIPLVFSLWLMMTKEDRVLMLHPDRFYIDRISLQPVESDMETKLKVERMRMGVELR